MNKLIAAIFLALLAAGTMSGCVVDDGRRGGGPPGHMDHHGDGDEHRDNHRDRDDDREHH